MNRRARLESLYWKVLDRYERRQTVYDAAADIVRRIPEGDIPMPLAVAATSFKEQYRPLVRQSVNQVASIEKELFDGEVND